jgi:hypothetical protein
MLLCDPRLRFARDLIGHWLDIRGGALVPLEANIDPRALLRCLDCIAIGDLEPPTRVIFKVVGARVSRRFGRDVRHVNWVDLVPPVLGQAGEHARFHVRTVPCGFYHKFTAVRVGAPAVTAEAMVLPLRHRIAAVPDAVIGMTRDFDSSAGTPPGGWLHPSTRVEHYFHELVDIGAGVATVHA